MHSAQCTGDEDDDDDDDNDNDNDVSKIFAKYTVPRYNEKRAHVAIVAVAGVVDWFGFKK